jgi:hypothetical protein
MKRQVVFYAGPIVLSFMTIVLANALADPPPECDYTKCAEVKGWIQVDKVLGTIVVNGKKKTKYGPKDAKWFYEKKDNGEVGAPIKTANARHHYTGMVDSHNDKPNTQATGKTIYKYTVDLPDPLPCTLPNGYSLTIDGIKYEPANEPPEDAPRENFPQKKCIAPAG